MEKKERKRKGSIKIRRKWKNFQTPSSSSSSSSSRLQQHADGDNTIFALMLAALSADSHKPIIKRCLNKLRLSFLSKIHKQTLPIPILSLLPVFLNSKCAEIVSNCAEIVGTASIFSFEMNEQIASDGEIVKGLVSAVGSTKRNVSAAACNAILDLSTTSIGRQRLLEFSSVESLIFCFLQVPKSSAALVSLCIEGKGCETCLRIGFKEDELPVLLLDAAITLINTCNIEQLDKIPRKLSETLLAYLKKLWAKVRKQMLHGTTQVFKQEGDFYVSNIRTNNLAESIFRLSINAGQFTTPFDFKVIKRSIFGWEESSFEHFMLNHWEISPLCIRRFSNALAKQDDIFSFFVQSLDFKEALPSFSSILENLISCPPIASDELDILSFLKEVRNYLGCPMIYQQDIRVLKTQQSKKEVHFFQESSGSCCVQAHQFLYTDDTLRCEEAYTEGYTVALRGVEFRFESIAAIADGLASLFGQPSAGANIYLTPPNSQGLARHCDDHCVLVCQLIGVKRWTIYPQLSLQLPRLYEPVDSLHDLEVERLRMDGCKQFLLKEGDVLYIPRGFVHEACTVVDNDGPNETAGFSLHLTLSIEVEPPFEWEGFAHVALHHWYQNQKQSDYTSSDSFSWNLNVMSVNLLHVAIKLIGDSDPTFRKACLVSSISLLSDTGGWFDLNQRTIFSHLVNRINTESRFLDALRSVEVAVQKNEDPLQQIRWLQHLNKEGEIPDVHNWNISSMGTESSFLMFDQHKDKAEAVFVQVKSNFCSEVVFEDVEQSYKILLEKYKKARKQYMSGMLSLHCN
uniref:Bifunctional lysine-specific demethylase and histidyl-hydroxylase n=1 Tax=Davidia involucrata TaxID=16924 RepID=A0A5B7C259_DAVIN